MPGCDATTPNHARTKARPTLALLTASAGALTLAALPGCGRTDDTTAAVLEADIKLVEVAGGAATDAGYAEGIYTLVESTLSPHAGEGPAGAADAASILLSSAQQGLAATATEKLAGLESEARHKADVIRGQLAEWSRMDAQARAAAAYDATPELEALDAELLDRRAQLDALGGKQAEAQARAADLQSQIDDLLSRAQSARNQSGELMLQMSGGTAAQAATLAPQVRDLTREADTLGLEAQRVQTTLEQFMPELNEINATIAKLEKQRELLTRSRTETVARAQAAADDAQAARTAADRAADDLRELVSDLQQHRAGDLADAFNGAISKARQAMQSAKKANSAVGRESGALSAALAQQALGHLQLRLAQSALTAASLYDGAHGAGAPGGYDSLAGEARAQAEEAHAEAMSAFEGAARGYRSVRAPGDVGTRLRETADLLERYAQTPMGETPDLTEPPEPEPETFDEGFDDPEDGFGAEAGAGEDADG